MIMELYPIVMDRTSRLGVNLMGQRRIYVPGRGSLLSVMTGLGPFTHDFA